MSIAVETLEVQVKSNATNASKAIRGLTNALDALRNVCQNGAGLKEVASALERMSKATANISAIKDTASAMKDLQTSVSGVANVSQSMTDSFDSATTAVKDVKAGMETVADATNKVVDEQKKLKETIKDSTKEIKKSNSFLAKMKQSLGRVAFYRAIRSAISWLAKSFKEGLTNAYNFSKTVGGQLAPALDSLATSSFQLKNQLGSVFGEVLIALMPIIQKFVTMITFLADKISQVMALFNGKTQYKKAKNDYAKYWDDATDSAKAYKSQTLGLDELNIISDDAKSGGSSGIDYENMFSMEDITLSERFSNIVEMIRKNMKIILPIAVAIGGALLLWNFGKALKDSPMLIVVVGAMTMLYGVVDAFANGIDWKNLTTILVGIGIVVGGLALKFGITGVAIGLLIGGIVLVITALHEMFKAGEVTDGAMTALCIGIVAIGGAIAILTGSWIPLAIAGFVALVGMIWHFGDRINEKIDEIWNKFDNFVLGLQQSPSIFKNILGGILRAVETIIGGAKAIIQGLIVFIKENFNGLVQLVDGIIHGDFKKALAGLLNMVFSVVNAITTMFSSGINVLIDMINSFGFDLPDWLKEKTGWGDFHLSIPHISIPKLDANQMLFADGGFPESGSLFFANENGASEYVGSYGNQSAVANNAQIVEGIQAGVTSAVSAVLAPYLMQIANNTRETANKDFSVNIGDREIARANARGQRAMGMSIISTV